MRRGRCRKLICMEAPPSSVGEGIREVWGSRPRAGRSEGSVWDVCTMAWALLLVTLLTQGTGEASREGTLGTSG